MPFIQLMVERWELSSFGYTCSLVYSLLEPGNIIGLIIIVIVLFVDFIGELTECHTGRRHSGNSSSFSQLDSPWLHL